MPQVTESTSTSLSPNGLRLGVSSGAFFPGIATEHTPELAAKAGVFDLELMLQTPGEYAPDFIRSLVVRCREVGCTVHSLHSFQDLIPVFSPYQRRAVEARAFFDRTIAATKALGASILVWHGPRRHEIKSQDDWSRFIATTVELAEACAKVGITLALENVSWCALATTRDFTTFNIHLANFDHSVHLGFVFDPFQAVEAKANPFLVLNAMLDRVVDVHLSDYHESNPSARHLVPGEGDLPWPALIRAIAASYVGPMMIEGQLTDYVRDLQRVQSFLNPLISAVVENPDPCSEAPPIGVLEGIRLFNDRHFYECHDEIENEWHAERRSIRDLYQGILQIGVGFYHITKNNYRGAVLLLSEGIDKASRFVPICLGIDVARLVRDSQICLDDIQLLGPQRLSEFNWESIPQIYCRYL